MKKSLLGKIGLEKGSITVEASIVVPIVVLSIICIILVGVILYQRSILQSVADKAVQAGAASWKSLSADSATGKPEMDELADSGLYWRLLEEDREEKTARLEKYAEALLEKRNILKPESSSVAAVIRNYAVYKRLELSIENSYILPGGTVMRLFGSDGKFKLKVTSFAVVDDPAELMRNTDLLVDIEKELENKYPGIKNLGEKTRGILNKMKDSLEKFTE